MPNHSVLARTPSADFTPAAFLLVAFLTGIASALQTPTLSLFLTNAVQATPQRVGLFFTASAIIGIGCSQLLARRSDRRGNRKWLISRCCLCGVLGCLLFAFSRDYFLLLFVGVLLNSFGNAASPQMFALAREYADHTGRGAVMFSAILRAQISLAWVVGPPLAYALSGGFGFSVMYLGAVVTFLICALMVWLFLPAMPRQSAPVIHNAQAPRRNRRDVLLLFVVCTMMWGANSLYIISMPLYITHTLHLPDKLAGLMMGTAAGLEIPAMLIAGLLAKKIGKRRLLRMAFFSALAFYLLLLWLENPLALISLQLLNAVFIGILAGIGMVYFQDLMPGQAGSATTLYANTSAAGWVISGLLAGVVAGYISYHAVFYFALLMMLIAGGCLSQIRRE